jgi:hypothetical protein
MRGMKRLLVVLILTLTASGCATFNKRWAKIEPGQSKDEILEIMQEPPHGFGTKGDQTAIVWRKNNFTECGVVFNADERVAEKNCLVDEEALARDEQRRAAMGMAYMQMRAMQPSQPSFRPVQSYQQTRPVQTNCQMRTVGDVRHYDCSSRPTGVDASIYR